jgi:hypothetical protein
MNFYLRVGSVNINTHFMNAVKHICMYNFVMDRVPRYAYNKGHINFGTFYSSLFLHHYVSLGRYMIVEEKWMLTSDNEQFSI